jgi:hypothetical protein
MQVKEAIVACCKETTRHTTRQPLHHLWYIHGSTAALFEIGQHPWPQVLICWGTISNPTPHQGLAVRGGQVLQRDELSSCLAK